VNDRVGNGWKVDTSTLIDEEVMMDQWFWIW
jgi:hypothetical protein